MGFANRLTVKNKALEYFMVTAIIVLVVVASFVALSAILAQSRDTQRISDVSALRNALELYYLDYGEYPPNEWTNSAAASWNTFAQMLAPYITAIPLDPINEAHAPLGQTNAFVYSYYSAETQTGEGRGDYILVFRLEKPAHAPDYQESDVGLVTAKGGISFLPLARAEGVYVMRAP
jgi:type II secretory pathway pseudopilin PulG